MKKYLNELRFIGITASISLLLTSLAVGLPWFAEWYAQHIFPVYRNTIGRFCSLFPFSVFEFMLYFLAVFVVVMLLLLLYWLIFDHTKLRQKLLLYLLRLICFASLIFCILTSADLIHYKRTSFSEFANLTVQESSKDELEALCKTLAEELNSISPGVERDSHSLFVTPSAVGRKGIAAMKNLAITYPVLDGYYPNPKPVTFSQGMSYLNLTGLYSPFTIEANYNMDVPGYNIPDTICHELAHLNGFIKEDEAGFIAYLACIKSDIPAFQYSGTMSAFIYATNALYDAGETKRYQEIMNSLDHEIQMDLEYNSRYWNQFEGQISQLAERANDSYLKANNQEGGTESYGRMVDLLLAYNRL